MAYQVSHQASGILLGNACYAISVQYVKVSKPLKYV